MADSSYEGKMNFTARTIFIISADPRVAHECIGELARFGDRYRTRIAISIGHALREFSMTPPMVVFLDESAVDSIRDGETMESAVSLLTEAAPVVVSAALERRASLAFLITAGAVDFVDRINNFIPIVAGMLAHRARVAERITGTIQFPHEELSGEFGEILRHEVNNPLTGILGNTELLLARREGLPLAAIERLQTIAELAVRLRETVRRLSNAWDEHHEHAGPV
jgi:signal transduction histidine kinase